MRVKLLLLLVSLLLITCGDLSSASQAPIHTAKSTRPLIIAHRGGAKESTENTILAFQRAVRIGADGIETDLRLTKDGMVIIYHDDKWGRVEVGKAGDRLISDMSFSEINSRGLRPVGDDQGGRTVPTLEDTLKSLDKGLLNIELKSGERFDELVDKTIEILKPFGGIDRVVLEPPDLRTARKFREALGANLKLHINPAYNRDVPFEDSLAEVLKFKPHSISVSYKRLNYDIIDQAHKAGVEVWVWTVDVPQIAQAMTLLGVDAIKTDVPSTMLKLLKRTRVL